MRVFEEPIVELIKFSVEDIMTTSGDVEELPPMGGQFGSNCI